MPALTPALVVPGAILAVASVFDVRTREIPDAFPLLLLAWAVASRLLGLQAADWGGAGIGFLVALGLGLLLFRLGVMGAGDGKLLGALGAVLGPAPFGVVFLWIALVGGALALGARRRPGREMVYGPAIAAGYALAVGVAVLIR